MSSRDNNNNTLYVVGVPDCANEQRIRDVFGQYGTIKEVTILETRADFTTHTVFIQYETFLEAKRAKEALNCTNPFSSGQTMTVKIADKDRRTKRFQQDRKEKEYDRRRRSPEREDKRRILNIFKREIV